MPDAAHWSWIKEEGTPQFSVAHSILSSGASPLFQAQKQPAILCRWEVDSSASALTHALSSLSSTSTRSQSRLERTGGQTLHWFPKASRIELQTSNTRPWRTVTCSRVVKVKCFCLNSSREEMKVFSFQKSTFHIWEDGTSIGCFVFLLDKL